MSEHVNNPKGNPNWRKGGPSPNPGGRPRSGTAFADAVRRRIDPDQVLDLVQRYIADETVPIDKRLAVVLPYVHSGFLKPPTVSASQVDVRHTTALPPGWDALPLEAKRRFLDELESNARRGSRAQIALLPAIDAESSDNGDE
jgi:hypothetical protein